MNIRAVLNNTRFWYAMYTRPRTCVLTEHKGESERQKEREPSTCDAARRLDYSDFSVVSNEFHPATGRG